MTIKALEIINEIVSNLTDRNKPETLKNIRIFADVINVSINENDLWTTDELKRFNGLMKYVMLAIENSDIDFAINLFRNDIYTLINNLIIKSENTDTIQIDKIDTITNSIKNQYTDFAYPNLWKGIIPKDLVEKKIKCTALYDLKYIQHVACRKIVPENELSVLIAGCGTGEGGIICALQHPKAKFTFVDISSSSLRMAEKYINELNITNIKIVQEDIMTMNLETQFDIIISTGVIHHLSDPSMGVNNLKKHLKQSGVLSGMVYGEYGRYEIGLFQEALKIMLKNNVDFVKGIEYVKTIFKNVSSENRIVNIAWKQDIDLGDQHIVDLLLNVNEHRYNVKSLCEMIENGGMKIVEFINMSTLNPDSYFKNGSEQNLSKDLSYFDRCRLAELINGKITKHDFYAIKGENEYKKLSVNDEKAGEYVVYKSPYLLEINIKSAKSENSFIKIEADFFEENNLAQYKDFLIDKSNKSLLDLCNGTNKISTIIKKLNGCIEPYDIMKKLNIMVERKLVFLHEK